MKADILTILYDYIGYNSLLRFSLITYITYIPWIGRRFIDDTRYTIIIDHDIKLEYHGLFNIMINNWHIYNTYHINNIINPNVNDSILISYYINGDNIIYVYRYRYRNRSDYCIYPDYTIRAYNYIAEIDDINCKIYEPLHSSNILYRIDFYKRYK